MERMIICAVLAAYAVYLDIRASILYEAAGSLDGFQVLPMIIWAAVVSAMAIVYLVLTIRKLRRPAAKRGSSGRKKAGTVRGRSSSGR